jgi:hypothetical protein
MMPKLRWSCGQFIRPAGSSIPTLDDLVPKDYGGCPKHVPLKYCIYAGTGKGHFFADKMPNHWRIGFENGNFLSICSLPVTTFCVPQKNLAAFAYPGGSRPLPFKTLE